jgi:nucleotide-binding universal stress UspA family protein
VPTDFSPAAEKAVERAVALANQCNASVTLLHVIDINARARSGAADDLMKGLWDEGSTRMGQLAWSLNGQVEAQTMLEEGLPWEKIVDKSEEFDLLVLGLNHPKRRFKLFSQHTGDRVLESAACPVMVVHDHA